MQSTPSSSNKISGEISKMNASSGQMNPPTTHASKATVPQGVAHVTGGGSPNLAGISPPGPAIAEQVLQGVPQAEVPALGVARSGIPDPGVCATSEGYEPKVVNASKLFKNNPENFTEQGKAEFKMFHGEHIADDELLDFFTQPGTENRHPTAVSTTPNYPPTPTPTTSTTSTGEGRRERACHIWVAPPENLPAERVPHM